MRMSGRRVTGVVAKAVPGFLPSVYGHRFANSFPPGPTERFGPFDTRILGFGDAASGLCGGMALTARDLFEAKIPAPADTSPPANGSPRFDALVRRQVQSLDWFRVPLHYLDDAVVSYRYRTTLRELWLQAEPDQHQEECDGLTAPREEAQADGDCQRARRQQGGRAR